MGFTTVAGAMPVTFTETYVKNYGSDYDGGPQAGNRPGLWGADCITVNDKTGVERFFDAIGFAGLTYDAIDTITLTLGFADVGKGKWLTELWLAFAPHGLHAGRVAGYGCGHPLHLGQTDGDRDGQL